MLTALTRRGALITLGLGVAVAAACPPIVEAVAVPPPAPPIVPAWCVGPEEHAGWRVLFAKTEDAAVRLYNQAEYACDCADPCPRWLADEVCDCECHVHAVVAFQAKGVEPGEDGTEDELTVQVGYDNGFSWWCDSCDAGWDEVADQWKIVDGKARCLECIRAETPDDDDLIGMWEALAEAFAT